MECDAWGWLDCTYRLRCCYSSTVGWHSASASNHSCSGKLSSACHYMQHVDAFFQTGNTTGPLVPYVTLLALWNVTDRNGSVDNSVHFNFNTSMSKDSLSMRHLYLMYWLFTTGVDMTFLECTLSWSVTAVTITNNDTAPETLNPHYCERRDNGQYDANMYPWDSVVRQALA
jgi:hypothetical protein